MPGSYRHFVRKLGAYTASQIDSPDARTAALGQDLDPRNFDAIDRELASATNDRQRNPLLDERRRLENLQFQQLQMASQQFAPKLQSQLTLEGHGVPPSSQQQEHMMNVVKIMMMMRNRMAPRLPSMLPQPEEMAQEGSSPVQ